ncbi:MAG: hypothetical protein ER33_12625 [Cyanobium sp. CACIAM 14]|nr:MAG: hypothetical protein ER33_12625 [Cyanobium sp. CACIAM 14]
MASPPTRFDPDSETSSSTDWLTPSQIGIAGVCLLVLYVLQGLSAFLPTRLLEPGWQLGVSNALINNGFLALLGLALVHLAAYLAPGNPRLARRRDDFASWALIAVLGFLLLIPLQGYALWRGISNVNAQQQNRLGTVSGRLATLRQAIRTAPTSQELQRRLAALKAPPLDAADLAQPLPKLRQSMLESLDRTEIRARDQLRGLPATDVWQLAQAGVRSVLSALVMTIAFASLCRRRGWEGTLLQQWLGRFQQRKRAFTPTGSKRGHRTDREEAEDYLRSLAEEDKPSSPPRP